MKTLIKIGTKLSINLIIMAIPIIAMGSNSPLPAMENTNVKKIEGKIIDSETKKPVIFANVYISETSIGTVSNSDGEFTLKIPLINLDKKISIDYIGYKSAEIDIKSINKDYIEVMMIEDPISIQEIIVRVDDPLKLLKMALNKIHENYSDKPAMVTSFYRETVKKNRSYVAVSEAILNIYKAAYRNDFSSDRVKIFKGRKSADVEKMDTVLFKLQGGPSSTVLLDVIKNPSTLLSYEYLDYYTYNFVGIVNIDGKQNYVISFDQNADLDMPLYSGKIYMEVDNLAITRVDFNLSEFGLKNAKQDLVRKKPANMKVDVISGNYLVKYRELNGKWYLNHVRSEVKFKCKWEKKLFRSTFTTMFEMAVTDMKNENVEKIKLNEASKLTDVFIDQVQYFEDEDYWGDYNYIKPDESIESAIQKLNKRVANK